MSDVDLIQADVRAILDALGLGTHARPYSAHEVVQREILPAIEALREPCVCGTGFTCLAATHEGA